MLPRFWSKTEMKMYHPMEDFEFWPEDTFSFCPKCGMDSFELLFECDLEIFIKCRVCNALWIIKSAVGNIYCETAMT